MRNLCKKSLKTLLPESSENSFFFYLLLFCCCLLFSSFLLLLDLPPITMKLWNFLKPILNIGMPPHGTFYRRRRSAYFSRTALLVVVSDPKRKRCVLSCRPHLKKRNGLNTKPYDNSKEDVIIISLKCRQDSPHCSRLSSCNSGLFFGAFYFFSISADLIFLFIFSICSMIF